MFFVVDREAEPRFAKTFRQRDELATGDQRAADRDHRLCEGHQDPWHAHQGVAVEKDDDLVSVPWILVSFTQSVIPIGCALIALCQLATLPERFREARLGLAIHDEEHEAIEAAVRDTEAER